MEKKDFYPFVKKETDADTQPPEQEVRTLIEEKERLSAQEKERGTYVTPEQVVRALFKENAIQKMLESSPIFRKSVEQAAWNERFVSMVERGNHYLKQILARFLFEPEVRRKTNLGLAYHGVAGEVMAEQVLRKSGLTLVHARPELDAVCGIDFLGYEITPSGGKTYFAIQVKISQYRQEPSFREIDSDFIKTLREKPARSSDEERMLESVFKCFKSVPVMRELSQKQYLPFLLELPSIGAVRDKIDLGTFRLPPDILDMWVKKVIEKDKNK